MKLKNILVLVCIIVLIIFSTIVVFIKNNKVIKKYDVDLIQKQFLSSYEEKNLRIFDFVDVISLFGFELSEVNDSTFMGNFTLEDELNKDMSLVVVINTSDPSYYDSLQSYLDSNLLYIEDKELFELYNSAVIKKGENFTYLIIDKDAKLMEKEINSYYKEIN